MNVFIFIWKILTLVQLPEGLCPLYESRRIALTPQSPRTSPGQRNKPLPITIISHIQPFLPSPREMDRITIFSDTRNHASPSINLAVPPPHVHASPTTAPRVSLSRSLAHPLHTKQHASDQGKRACNECKPSPSSSCKFTSPLLLSLCVTSPLSSSSLSRYSCFILSLVLFTDVHTGIVPRSWSNWKQSSIPSVVAGYGNERHGAESRAERERGRWRGKGTKVKTQGWYTSNILFFFCPFIYRLHWLVGYSNRVS